MRILAVGAHPDDVEFGCAPVLIREARAGHDVHILVCSLGEAASSGSPEEREHEARQAAKVIGASIEFVDFGGDCHIEANPVNAINMAREIRRLRPDAVLAPHTGENQHPDHSSLGKVVRDALRLARYGGLYELTDLPPHVTKHLYYYAITQIFTDRPPELMIDVSDTAVDWQAAIACHGSQMKTRSYPELVLSRARALGASIGVEYAVGLWLNDPVRVNSLSELPLSSRYF